MSISSAEGSPSQSPLMSPTTGRRLSSRRGSISAPDPWGTHAPINLNPSRTTQSRLTIVRVSQQPDQADGRYHRRHGSNASLNSNSSKGEGGRLSFAFTSFGSGPGPAGSRTSPSSSPRLRPSTPTSPQPGRSSFSIPTPHSKLAPEKVVELARSSCNPRPSPGTSPLVTQQVSFTPLPDNVWLPFVDRPSEVSALVSALPTAKLLALLSQTFPLQDRATAAVNPSAGTPKVDSDPKTWSFAQLENWLKNVPREEVDDATYVRKARQCILSHSELLWERIKGALGVPPDIDTDEPEEDPLERYLPPRPAIDIPRKLDSAMLDADVFEPDSPVVAPSLSHASHQASSTLDVPPSPTPSDLELSIEPVVAHPPPPPSAVDPTTGANMTSLHELREEDENENEDVGSSSVDSSHSVPDSAVQGLRISMSGSAQSYTPIHSVGHSPSPARRPSMNESVYDALNERGPGHPLFPSNFAHLSNGPTLRSSSRSNSMSFPPSPVAALRRADSSGAVAGRRPRPDWARGWDINKHEDAITVASGSVSGFE